MIDGSLKLDAEMHKLSVFTWSRAEQSLGDD